jgi:photosystem II stability/assembly factor-like uncharacterized protein
VLSPAFSTDKTVFLCIDLKSTSQPSALMRSTDGGEQWTQLASPPDLSKPKGALRVTLSPDYATDSTVFVYGPGGTGLWKSTDRGDSWTALTTVGGWTITDTPAYYDSDQHSVACSPAFATDRTLFAVGVQTIADGWMTSSTTKVIKSTDGGATWSALTVGAPVDAEGYAQDIAARWVAVSPGYASDHTVLAGGGEFVWRSTDGGENWGRLTTPSFLSEIVGVAFSPAYAADRTMFARMVDVPSVYARTTDGGATWAKIGTPEESALTISPGYATDQSVFVGLSRSIDGGRSWKRFGSGFTIKDDGSPSNVAVPSTYPQDKTVLAVVNGCFCAYTFATPSAPKLALKRSAWRSNRFKGVLYRWAEFTLKVYPPTTHAKAYLRTERSSGGTWKRVQYTKMDPAYYGVSAYNVIDDAWVSYELTCAALKPGRYRFRAYFEGDDFHLGKHTEWQYVTLR